MKKIVRLTENDLKRIVKRVIKEDMGMGDNPSYDDMESTTELDEIVDDLVNNATFNDGREVFVGYGLNKTILGSWGRMSATSLGMKVFNKFFDGYCMSNYGITDMSDLNYIKNEFETKMTMKIDKEVNEFMSGFRNRFDK